MCCIDEAYTINEILEETGWCKSCSHKGCKYCGKCFEDVFKPKKS